MFFNKSRLMPARDFSVNLSHFTFITNTLHYYTTYTHSWHFLLLGLVWWDGHCCPMDWDLLRSIVLLSLTYKYISPNNETFRDGAKIVTFFWTELVSVFRFVSLFIKIHQITFLLKLIRAVKTYKLIHIYKYKIYY